MNVNKVYFRVIKDKIFKIIIILLSFIATLPLFFILFYIIKEGIGAVNWNFFIALSKNGGIANAIVGTFILIFFASLFSVPIGIGVGIYLSEFKHSKLAHWVRVATDILQGIPSIVIGIIAYIWIVKPAGSFSALSGAIALAMMMLPVIIRSTEETLKLVPHTLKEASLSLGVPYHKTVLKVVVPTGISGILTGILLGIARIAGETAPLLFTAFGNPYMNLNVLKPIHSLPHMIFVYSTQPSPESHKIAWGASLVLIIFVLILNLIARGVARKWKVQF
jgi:phosphate transport system permease protein